MARFKKFGKQLTFKGRKTKELTDRERFIIAKDEQKRLKRKIELLEQEQKVRELKSEARGKTRTGQFLKGAGKFISGQAKRIEERARKQKKASKGKKQKPLTFEERRRRELKALGF